MAIACGNLQVAFDAAKDLQDKDCFSKLAKTSTALGNYEITEKVYQISRQFDKLNFFYAATGSINKLNKMQTVAQSLGDSQLRFNTATLTANAAEKVKILAENGQIPLAYMTAKAHGLDEFVKPLETTIRESDEYDHERIFREAERFVGTQTQRPKALLPLRPIFTANQEQQEASWPMVNLRAKEAERAAQMFKRQKQEFFDGNDDMFFDAKEYHTSNKQVANILSSEPSGGTTEDGGKKETAVEEATLDNLGDAQWGDDGDAIEIEMDDELIGEANPATGDPLLDAENFDADIFVPPSPGPDPLKQALKKHP